MVRPGGMNGVIGILLIVGISYGQIRTAVVRLPSDQAVPEFKLPENPSGKVPFPSQSDVASKAAFTLVDGTRDSNGGELRKLNDGKLPAEADQPAENFFFAAGTDGGRLTIDIGNVLEIAQVNSYSWHTGGRAPQVYTLYASDGKAADFNAAPKKGTAPDQCGWKQLAKVDTRPKTPLEFGGQYGVSVFDPKGPLGSYRYLLFDIVRTDPADRFGNTFFSEIDVVAAGDPIVAAVSSRAVPGPVHRDSFTADPGGYEIVIDTTETPDLTEWATKELAPVLQKWYPKIVEMLPSEGYQAPKRVPIVFSQSMQGVAATGGTRVSCAATWFRNNLKGEAVGAVVHELVHVVQQYGQARQAGQRPTRTPGWVVEGIADYIRWFLYEPQTRGAEISPARAAQARYDASYRVSANFINWVTKNHAKDIVARLNVAAREGRYTEDLWKEATGLTVQELGEKWKQSLAEAKPAEEKKN
ncbi:MAG: hypothetical protein GX455_08280 [Phycisphaerae bacterium]|nr:hypothetical protein [Phycisphaerae bacterium]